MREETRREAVALLHQLRERADREGSMLPSLAGASHNSTTSAYNAAREALIVACYYNVDTGASVRADRVAAVDRAIKSLEAL